MYYPALQTRYRVLGDEGYLLDLRSGDVLQLAPPYARMWEQALRTEEKADSLELEAFIELALANGYLTTTPPVKDVPHIKLKVRKPGILHSWIALQRMLYAFQNQQFGTIYQAFAALEKPGTSNGREAKVEKAFSRAVRFSVKPSPLIRSFALYFLLIEAGVRVDHVIGIAPGPVLLSWVEVDGARYGAAGDFLELDRF
jgi:hypothetical protein